MTAPAATPQIAPVDTIPVQIQGGITPGPDGRPWIVYEISEGLHSHRFAVPVGTAAQIPDLVKQVTDELLARAGHTQTGLILPPGAGAVVVPRMAAAPAASR